METKKLKVVTEVISKLHNMQKKFAELSEDRKELLQLYKNVKNQDDKEYLGEALDALEELDDAMATSIDALENIEEDD